MLELKYYQGHKLRYGRPSPCWAHTQHGLGHDMPSWCRAYTSAPLWARATTHELNVFGSNQCIWTHSSSLMGFNTLLGPNTTMKNFLGPYAGPSVFYTHSMHIILSKIQLKTSQWWNYTWGHPFNKKTKLMNYKYTINPSNVKFIFFIFLAHIFSEFLSLKYLCIFSLYKVTYLNIRESPHLQKKKKNCLQVLATNHLGLLSTKNQLPIPLSRKNRSDC